MLTDNIRKLFAKHPNAQASYEPLGAFKDLISADLDLQVSTALSQFKALVAIAQKTWASTASKYVPFPSYGIPDMAYYGVVKKLYTAVVIKENQDAIADFIHNVATYISYDKTGMLACSFKARFN